MQKRAVSLFAILAICLAMLPACSSQGSSPASAAPASAEAASSQPALDKQLSIATSPVGGGYYMMGTGLAKMFTSYLSISSSVFPFEGPDAYVSELQDNKLQMAVISGVNAAWSFAGQDLSGNRSDKLRMVVGGNVVPHLTVVTRASNNINRIEDLKGKKFGSGYGSNKLTQQLALAALASGGLTEKDVVPVPLTELNDSINAIQLGRVDAAYAGSPTTSQAVQLAQQVPVKVLPIGDLKPDDIANGTPDNIQKIIDEYVPGAVLMAAPAGGVLEEPTVLFGYPIDLITNTDVSGDTVYAVMEALWDHYQDLTPVSSWATDWTPKNFVVENFPVPYHDGAIRFLKEKGLWTDTMQARQDKLLAQ